MYQGKKCGFHLICILFIYSFFLMPSAQAALLRFDFTGTVVSTFGVPNAGTSVSGYITFDPDAPASSCGLHCANYSQSAPATFFFTTNDGFTLQQTLTAVNISDMFASGTGDYYVFDADVSSMSTQFSRLELTLSNNSNPFIPDTNIPRTPPDFSAFQFHTVSFFGFDSSGPTQRVHANLTSLRGGQDRLLTTSWGQAAPYTYFYDGDKDKHLEEYKVGCTAVAIGQLINYYFHQGYRDGWLEDLLAGVTVYPRFCQDTFLGRHNIGGFFCTNGKQKLSGYVTEAIYVDSISQIDSPGADALRAFLWNVALGLDSEFQENVGTGVGTRYWSEYLKTSNKYIDLLRDRFRFKDTMTASALLSRLDLEKAYIKSSIDNHQPVLMSLRLKVPGVKSDPGHMVLIDGYNETPEGVFQVKINWGWGNLGRENNPYYNTDGSIAVTYTYPDHPQKVLTAYNFRLFANTVPINY